MTNILYTSRRRIGFAASLTFAVITLCHTPHVLAAESGPAASLPNEGRLPSLEGATAWLNSKPLTRDQLLGKVVLIDFWAYSCINCLREAPYIKAWDEKYRNQGLVVIGVHTPEFRFETNLDNIQRAVDRAGLTYPIAVDSDQSIWSDFGNQYWPALYFIDVHGHIRHHQFGEGHYEQSEHMIQALLSERAAPTTAPLTNITPQGKGAEAPPDFADLGSSETYLGYKRQAGFVSEQTLQEEAPNDYSFSALNLNQWGLQGRWTVNPEQIVLNAPNGIIAYRFHARDLHLVLGREKGAPAVHFQILIDGKAPGENHGVDTDSAGRGTITETRLYQLIRQNGPITDHTFEVRFEESGVDAYSFTFG